MLALAREKTRKMDCLRKRDNVFSFISFKHSSVWFLSQKINANVFLTWYHSFKNFIVFSTFYFHLLKLRVMAKCEKL